MRRDAGREYSVGWGVGRDVAVEVTGGWAMEEQECQAAAASTGGLGDLATVSLLLRTW